MSDAASPGCCTALLCWALECWRQPLACRAQETSTAKHMQRKGYSTDLGPKHVAQCEAHPAQHSAAWHLDSPAAFRKLQSPVGVLPHHAGQGSTCQRHSSSPCSSGLVWHSPAPLRLSLAALSWRACQWLHTDHTVQHQGYSLPVEAGAKQSNICTDTSVGRRLTVSI